MDRATEHCHREEHGLAFLELIKAVDMAEVEFGRKDRILAEPLFTLGECGRQIVESCYGGGRGRLLDLFLSHGRHFNLLPPGYDVIGVAEVGLSAYREALGLMGGLENASTRLKEGLARLAIVCDNPDWEYYLEQVAGLRAAEHDRAHPETIAVFSLAMDLAKKAGRESIAARIAKLRTRSVGNEQ
jgi:hypothetical protein